MSFNRYIIGASAVVFLIGAFTLSEMFYKIEPYEVGVLSRFGEIRETSNPGLHFKIPVADNVLYLRTDVQNVKGTKINTFTSDSQEVDVDFNVVYRIDPQYAQYIAKNLPDYQSRLIALSISKFKEELGKFGAYDIAPKRAEISKKVFNSISNEAERLFKITLIDFQMNDVQYTPSFRQAVDNAAVAKTLVEKAEADKRTQEVQAQTAKIRAIGEADASREKARGEADAKLLQAEAESRAVKMNGEAAAAAIKAQSEALNTSSSTLVELEKAKRWNGQLPTNMYGSAPIPYLNATPSK